ncbi:MAG: hypothetical protein ACOCRX_06765 [Candidatus Woesearchaeota archaeon]
MKVKKRLIGDIGKKEHIAICSLCGNCGSCACSCGRCGYCDCSSCASGLDSKEDWY